MTSNEDAKIRKHVYKSLKRGSPTPLYYPLARLAVSVSRRAGVALAGRAACVWGVREASI